MIKFETYNSTPGLERYPLSERCAAWRGVHKQLLRKNAEYRKRYRSFNFSIIALTCIMLPASLGFGFFYVFPIGTLRVALEIIVPLMVTACYTFAVVRLSLRQQHFMNQSIGQHLQIGGIPR